MIEMTHQSFYWKARLLTDLTSDLFWFYLRLFPYTDITLIDFLFWKVWYSITILVIARRAPITIQNTVLPLILTTKANLTLCPALPTLFFNLFGKLSWSGLFIMRLKSLEYVSRLISEPSNKVSENTGPM